jgi:ComF family protein
MPGPALGVMTTLPKGLMDLVLPPICGRCMRPTVHGAALCVPCDRALLRWSGPDAPPPGIDTCAAGLVYAGEALNWVQRFKYPKRGFSGLDPAAVGVLRAIIRQAASIAPAPDPLLVVPVALHPRTLRRRGFNPAALLARDVARQLGSAVDTTALVRVRDTRSQTGLGRTERLRNVRGAFRARTGLLLPECVWLVDDVVTTGSTVAEAGRALRRAGARTVVVICAARTPSPT